MQILSIGEQVMVRTSKSPLTGMDANVESQLANDSRFYEEDLGIWGATQKVVEDGFRQGGGYRSTHLTLSQLETARILALACSLIWQTKLTGAKSLFFMTEDGIERLKPEDRAEAERIHQLRSPESLWHEFRQIRFEEKVTRTLENFVTEEDEMGNGVAFPVSLKPYPGRFTRAENEISARLTGMLFACVGNERPLVLSALTERDLIRGEWDESSRETRFIITPAGYSQVDQLQHGNRDEVNSAFLICRFNEELDLLYSSVYLPTGDQDRLRCPIRRVKDVHHVDRIDDKIIRMIQEATIVVVDLTDHNFNVAFEAGYALALNKPIVWTMRKDGEDLQLPFDIQSQNILRWDATMLDEFAELLTFRMLAALDKVTKPRTGKS